MKMIKAILHTAGKTDEQILKQGGIISPNEISTFRKILEAWDGVEVYVNRAAHSRKEYTLMGWDEKDHDINNQVKEALFLMEQDPIVGTYVDNREQFERDWNEREYTPSMSITFAEEDVEILEETPTQRLARLIMKYPDLPVIPMVDWEICASDSGRWMASIGRAYVAEFIYNNDDPDQYIMYRHAAHRLVDALAEEAEKRIKTQEEAAFVKPDQSLVEAERKQVYEEARQRAWKKVNEMEWRKALFVEIDLPEGSEV